MQAKALQAVQPPGQVMHKLFTLSANYPGGHPSSQELLIKNFPASHAVQKLALVH